MATAEKPLELLGKSATSATAQKIEVKRVLRALIIAPQPFFSPRGTPLSVYYRALIAAELGVQIDLLTYGEGENVLIPGVRIVRIPRVRLLEPVSIGPSIAKLLLDVLLFFRGAMLLMRGKYDFVHAHEEAVFFCWVYKKLFGCKFIYDMHSSLPEQLVNFGYTRSRLLIRLFKFMEKLSLKTADAVLTICPELEKLALTLMPDGKRHLRIENSIFEEVMLDKRWAGNERPAAPDLPENKRLIGFIGSFEEYQGLDIVIPAFANVAQQRPDVFLVLIGGRPDQIQRVQELAECHRIADKCKFTGPLDQTTARRYMSRLHLLVSPRTRGTNTPLKIYEQLACGLPLVATRIASHTQVLNDRVCWMVDPNADSFARGIIEALTNGRKCVEMTTSAMALYNNKYGRHLYKRKMKELLSLLQDSNERSIKDSQSEVQSLPSVYTRESEV